MLRTIGVSYSISELVRRLIVIPIKKGKRYINKQSSIHIDPHLVWDKYFEWGKYAFGWILLAYQYDFTTQVPERYTIYNTKISGKKTIDGLYKFRFRKVRESFFYWIKDMGRKWELAKVLSPERLLIQMIREWASFEFLEELPENVDTKILFSLAEKYAPRRVLAELTDRYG